MRTIYAIYDTKAEDLLGGPFALTIFRTDQQAIRYFYDSMNAPNSAVAAHPQDYNLITLGYIQDDGRIDPLMGSNVVLTGAALLAMANEQNHTELSKVS